MTTGGASADAGLAVSRGRECGGGLLVTPRRGGLRAREAHGAALGCQGGTRQQRRDNDAQHKTHKNVLTPWVQGAAHETEVSVRLTIRAVWQHTCRGCDLLGAH